MTLENPQRDAIRGLLKQAVEQPPKKSHRVLVASLVVGPVAAALVVASAIVIPGASSAEAAEALRSAADVTITSSDPVIPAGGYLKITTDAAYLAYESDDTGSLTAYLSPSVTEVWVPGDDEEDWVQRVTAEPATTFYGDAARAAADRDWAATQSAGVVRETTAADGEFVEVTELGGEVDRGPLPDTPQAVLDYLHSTPDSSDEGALSFAAELLRTGTMTADERAVLYEALALLPGIRVADDEAVLDGRTGIAFSLEPDGALNRMEIVIDPATGLFIGERMVSTTDQDAIPAGTDIEYTAVTTEVVTTAP